MIEKFDMFEFNFAAVVVSDIVYIRIFRPDFE